MVSEMNLELKSAELIEENGQFYLYAIYSRDKDGVKSEIHIPRIEIPFMRSNNIVMNNVTQSTHPGLREVVEMDIDVGKGPLFLSKIQGPKGSDVFFWEQYLEREMTVAEIEEKLGYKIKVVGNDA
jgi:hypothetical protein